MSETLPEPYSGVTDMAKKSHENAKAKGFHDLSDRLKAHASELSKTDPELAEYILQVYWGNRIMLIVGELSEAHEELRTGHAMDETYY